MSASETTTKCPWSNQVIEQLRIERGLSSRAKALDQIVIEWTKYREMVEREAAQEVTK